jgi:hypothetical protein
VSLALTFGRFLSVASHRDTRQELVTNLTEPVFRKLYKGTRGNEADRFADVLKKLSGDVPAGYKNLALKPGFRKAVAEIMADGLWRTVNQILRPLQEVFPEADSTVVKNALGGLRRKPPSGKEIVSQKIGTISQYRMRDAVLTERQAPTRLVTSLVEGVKPIIRDLKEWGRHSEYEMSPSAIRMLAAQLENLFEPLTQFESSKNGSWDSLACHNNSNERKNP